MALYNPWVTLACEGGRSCVNSSKIHPWLILACKGNGECMNSIRISQGSTSSWHLHTREEAEMVLKTLQLALVCKRGGGSTNGMLLMLSLLVVPLIVTILIEQLLVV